MLKINGPARLPIESFVLNQPRAAGALVGYFGDHPFADMVVDPFGRRYRYVGVAPRRRDGTYDLEALRSGEWIVEPGLIYLYESSLH